MDVEYGMAVTGTEVRKNWIMVNLCKLWIILRESLTNRLKEKRKKKKTKQKK